MCFLTRCRISMCQGLGPKKHDEISEIDRITGSRGGRPAFNVLNSVLRYADSFGNNTSMIVGHRLLKPNASISSKLESYLWGGVEAGCLQSLNDLLQRMGALRTTSSILFKAAKGLGVECLDSLQLNIILCYILLLTYYTTL